MVGINSCNVWIGKASIRVGRQLIVTLNELFSLVTKLHLEVTFLPLPSLLHFVFRTPSGRGHVEGQACDAGAFLKGSAFVVASGQSGDFWNLEMGNSVCLLGPPRLWDKGHIRTSPQAVQILKTF